MFLSFVVPVYNTENYLRACLMSALDQDIPKNEYEIICVDDGSTDGSLALLEEIASHFPNVRVFHQQNAGVSTARNRGIEEARGDYLWFIDSDDLVAKNSLGQLLQLASIGKYDRIAFNYYLFQEMFTPEEQAAYDAGTLNGGSRYKNANVVTCLVRKQIIDNSNLRFSSVFYGEDSLFMFQYLLHAKTDFQIEQTLYYYRQRPESAMTSDSPETHHKRYVSFRSNAIVMKGYYEGKNGPVSDIPACADLFVSFLHYALWEVSMMPRKKAKQELMQLMSDGLYPYPRPAECTLTKSYMTTRTDLYGKLFDFLYLHLSTRIGFWMMRVFLHLKKRIRVKSV